ncbi:MAG: hypothetical protein M3O61_16315 [Gemmatimonadota bacterium]|nr:hypothetical protein [Gemmatimonadota bacterium]
MAAAAGISLTDTCVEVIKRHRKKGSHIDIEQLIEEVRVTALVRIDEADAALSQFERTLVEKGVDVSRTLQQCIDATPGWKPFESKRLKRYRKSFNALADAAYDATDDIASLLRCMDKTADFGSAVSESAKRKHALHANLLNARSFKDAIALLRSELDAQKIALKG